MRENNRGVLYLTYTGLLEPLGQSQVLAYLEHLSGERPVHIISFERGVDMADAKRMAALRERLVQAGIAWYPCRYHKRLSLLATLWDVLVGSWKGFRIFRRNGLAIIHARSYIPSVMALLVRVGTGAKFLFDMRGFWADERVDGGIWKRGGLLYRTAKRFERKFLESADHVVSLTQAGVDELRKFDYLQEHCPPMTVIPTCADLARFRPIKGRRDPGRFTLGYVGSAGTWYLFDATARAFRHLLSLRPEARLLVVNRSEHELIRRRLAAEGIPEDRVELRSARYEEVPELMARMDATAFFIKPSFSKRASAPTKLAEFLGCGIPCLANAGVGDMAGILREDGVGVALDSLDDVSIREGTIELLGLCDAPGVRDRCVASAHKRFSLEEGVARYRRIYEELDRA